jgi:hypothetical protein
MLKGSINCDQGFGAAAQKHLTVFFNQILSVPVVCRKVKISLLHQMIANGA